MGDFRSRLASLSLSTSLLVVVGALGGCGDNAPKAGGTGGGAPAGMGGHATGGVGGGAVGGAAGGGDLGGVGGAGAGGAGGVAGAGVAGAGGVAGMGGAGGAPVVACYTTAFTTPATNNATLDVTNDTDHNCGSGFQYTVQISSSAPDGTDVSLFDGIALLKTATVTGGAATFDVQLATTSTAQVLSIQYPGTTACNVTRTVTVNCSDNPPTCAISQPVISATHPALNGVPVTSGGDRVSSTGSAYQATFKVQTSVEDGQPVTLALDNQASPAAVTSLNATATGGVATFTATLASDGNWDVVATCINKNGISSISTKATFPVDTTPPNLTVTTPTSGQFILGQTVPVCGQTTSTDAAAATKTLGANPTNFCVNVGSSATPTCMAMANVNAPSCLNIPCPGAGANNLTVTLRDWAGNPTAQTITGVSCVASLPSVQVIAPASDAPTFGDKTKHILAASAPVGNKDLDANTPGAQVNVTACTDTVGTAILKVGQQGGALTQLGASVPTAVAVAGDNCPAGLPNVVKFSGVTLPESTENADGSLAAATELTVTVTSNANVNAVGTSLPDDVWVDTTPPAVSQVGTECGQFVQSSSTVHQDLSFNADDRLAVLEVTNGSVTTTYDTPAFMTGVATFPGVALTQGLNNIVVTVSDPAGNASLLSPNPCTVTIGAAPVVTFTTPTAGAILCPAGASSTACIADNDAGTAGWQGSLAVTVTVGSGPAPGTDAVTFTIGGTTLGSANLDGAGHAQLNGVTIPEGVQTIVATTANLAGAGTGTGTVTVTVDTAPPAAPTGLTVTVVDRRKTSMQVTWTAPADGGGGNVAGYQIRYAKVPIDATNFDNPAVTVAVPYTGAPAAAGQIDGIIVSSLYIETGYYFAVKATDVAGSISPLLATSSATAAHFLSTVISGTGTDGIGQDLDGSGDFGTAGSLAFAADGISDLVVGAANGQNVYVYFGTAAGFSATPSITITGSVAGFGAAAINAGDLDGDGLADIAVASPADGGGGKVYVFSRKNPPSSWGTTTSWPATLSDTQANYVLTADATFAGGANSIQARALARLGNFDGAGADDLAIGFAGHSAFNGSVLVVRGSSTFGTETIPDPAGVNTLQIDSAIAGGVLGYDLVGIAGPTLVAAAPGTSNLFTFAGQATTGTITTANASASFTGSGIVYAFTLGYLGPLGSSTGAISVGDTFAAPAFVDVDLGTPGSLTPSVRLVDAAAGNSFGVVNMGGGIKGTSQAISLIGDDATSDLIVAGQAETASPIYIVNGAVLPTLSGTVDVSTTVKNETAIVPTAIAVAGQIPSGWGGYAGASIIVDSNKDGYPDFAVGEFAPGKAGRVVVFY
ncbi:MAG TPA: FG-GAP-like repeat-containing protein [Polyangia bacterium]|nr:FG-GAP-like repeat-containing protein [Polyangia bacterium]